MYFAGLLVYNRREAQKFEFVKDGGITGLGYVPYFRKAEISLLLTHADDDAPSEELNQIYRKLLAKGVAMRRLVFLRDEAPDEAYSWIADFGPHPNLQHRLVPPEDTKSMKFSFVVVDESTVIVSVPGYETLDAQQYAGKFILRHVFVLKDSEAAKVFSRMHADLWSQAIPLDDVNRIKTPKQLIIDLRTSGLKTALPRPTP